jgi:hypothetical protein
MKARHIILLAALALTVGLTLAGQAAAKPGPLSGDQISGRYSTTDLVQRWLQRQQAQAQAPDLIERYVQRQPASAYYTPAALKAYGLRMQAMARAYESPNTTASSDSFDTRDALIGAAGGLGIAICAAGLLVAVTRSRRPQIAL